MPLLSTSSTHSCLSRHAVTAVAASPHTKVLFLCVNNITMPDDWRARTVTYDDHEFESARVGRSDPCFAPDVLKVEIAARGRPLREIGFNMQYLAKKKSAPTTRTKSPTMA